MLKIFDEAAFSNDLRQTHVYRENFSIPLCYSVYIFRIVKDLSYESVDIMVPRVVDYIHCFICIEFDMNCFYSKVSCLNRCLTRSNLLIYNIYAEIN